MSEFVVAQALAERLALPLRSSGSLQGEVEGAPVAITVTFALPTDANVTVYHLNSDGLTPAARMPAQLRVAASFPFRPALDAGINARPAAALSALQAAGRAGFAQRFAVRGTEADRVEALLREAQGHLDAAFQGDPGVTLNDQGISCTWQTPPPYPTVEQLESAIRSCARAHQAILAACRTVRPPTGLEEAAVALAGIPLPPGVELRGCPLGLAGVCAAAEVSVSVAAMAGGGWLARVRVALPELIPGAPKVLREDKFGWFERLTATLAGRGEITVGDRAFDSRFAVRSLKPDALKEALTKPVREGMLALDRLVPVELTGAEIRASGPVKGEAQVRAVADAAFALARAVSED